MNENALYIGVAGLLAEHVEEIAEFYELKVLNWENKSRRTQPLLFLGLQTSRKFLNGEVVNPVYSSRMNSKEQIVEACRLIQYFYNSYLIVHYNPSGGYNLPGVKEHLDFLKNINPDGVQFNGFSTNQPTDATIMQLEIDSEALGITSILQIGKEDYENPKHFAEEIKNFSFLNHTHLLLDGSGGKGIPIDELKASAWITSLLQSKNKSGIAISGGLGGEDTFDILRRIKSKTPAGYGLEISIDAEGKLRDESGFSIEKTKEFLIKAVEYYS